MLFRHSSHFIAAILSGFRIAQRVDQPLHRSQWADCFEWLFFKWGSFNRASLIRACVLLVCLLVQMAGNALLTTSAQAQTPTAVGSRPNVIFILLDDFGYGDFGVFWQNARAAKAERHRPWHFTPSIDRIAKEGMRLPEHYAAASVCAPSRASLLLGVHQGHANVRDNQFDKALEDNHTLGSVLRAAGYRTVAIGKYGLQGDAPKSPDEKVDSAARLPRQAPQWPAHPNRRGFQEFYGYIRHADGHEHYPKEGITRGPKEIWHNRSEVSHELDKCYTTDLFTARAKQYLLSHQKQHQDEPFFMYLAYDTPHAALTLPTGPYPKAPVQTLVCSGWARRAR